MIRIGAELSVTLRIFVADMKLIFTIILSMSMFFGIEAGIRGAEIGDSLARRADSSRFSPAQKFIDLKMAEEPFRSGVCGILAVSMNGDTLAEYGSMRKLIPASNTKLITTGLALNSLGPGFRFTTRLGYTGHVSNGTLHGDLYIVGGGDPTIASGDMMAPSRDTLFATWKRALTRAGIHRISGLVIGDGRFFDGPIENENWAYNSDCQCRADRAEVEGQCRFNVAFPPVAPVSCQCFHFSGWLRGQSVSVQYGPGSRGGAAWLAGHRQGEA